MKELDELDRCVLRFVTLGLWCLAAAAVVPLPGAIFEAVANPTPVTVVKTCGAVLGMAALFLLVILGMRMVRRVIALSRG